MNAFTLENPVFVNYMIAAAIMVLKIMGQGWMTVYRMLKSNSGLVSPEDIQVGLINKDPKPEQLELNDYVDRSRRLHRNDLENIPAFLAIGLLYVVIGPTLMMAQIMYYGFVTTRLIHTIVYATKQTHEVRATFYTIGSVIVIIMAVQVFLAGMEYL
ncbi:MAG: MAPEG family protein [Kordiimonadaceae bacterium]|nr:MAPEG family protein [Kordiimonadaceae bacterium]